MMYDQLLWETADRDVITTWRCYYYTPTFLNRASLKPILHDKSLEGDVTGRGSPQQVIVVHPADIIMPVIKSGS